MCAYEHSRRRQAGPRLCRTGIAELLAGREERGGGSVPERVCGLDDVAGLVDEGADADGAGQVHVVQQEVAAGGGFTHRDGRTARRKAASSREERANDGWGSRC